MLERIRELGIPPAWREVWICPYPNGHLQATGSTPPAASSTATTTPGAPAATREKFDDMTRFARALPRLRERVEADLAASDALTRERVLACAVRLLDRGFFRIGTEEYTVTTSPTGWRRCARSTSRSTDDGTMVFDYPAKSGKRRVQAVVDPLATEIVGALKRRRGGGAGAARLQVRPRVVRPTLRRHQRLPQGRHRRRLLRQGLPDLERDRDRRASRSPSPAPRTARRPRASARSRARSRRPRTTSATRPRCAAPPTSTRASSTPSAAGSCSTRRDRRGARREPGELPTHHPQIELAVLDLLDERESRPGRREARRLSVRARAAFRSAAADVRAVGLRRRRIVRRRRRFAVRRRIGGDGRLLGHGGRDRLGRDDGRRRLLRLRDLECRAHASTFIPDP